MVDNDGDGYRACSDKASDFDRWTEEGPTSDPLCAARHKDDVEGLIELRHFFVGVCFDFHSVSETGNVPVAGLVHRGERVEESCPGGVEGHDGWIFFSSTSATRQAMTRGRGKNDNNEEMPSPRGFEKNLLPLRSSLHLMKLGAEGGSRQFPLLTTASKIRGLGTKGLRKDAHLCDS
jgi:hypothetical protein